MHFCSPLTPQFFLFIFWNVPDMSFSLLLFCYHDSHFLPTSSLRAVLHCLLFAVSNRSSFIIVSFLSPQLSSPSRSHFDTFILVHNWQSFRFIWCWQQRSVFFRTGARRYSEICLVARIGQCPGELKFDCRGKDDVWCLLWFLRWQCMNWRNRHLQICRLWVN
jgi:hypothetical protein